MFLLTEQLTLQCALKRAHLLIVFLLPQQLIDSSNFLLSELRVVIGC